MSTPEQIAKLTPEEAANKRMVYHVVYDDGQEETIRVKPIHIYDREGAGADGLTDFQQGFDLLWIAAGKPGGDFHAWAEKIEIFRFELADVPPTNGKPPRPR